MFPIINTVRQDKNLNPFVFVKDLSNLPFHEIYESCHPNTMLSKFTTLFLSILDKHAPFKQITISKPPAPWIDNSIKKMIFKRDKVYRKAKKTQNPADLFQYSLLHKKVKHCIFQAKQNFIDKRLSKPNLKKVWNVINRLLKPSCKPILHDIYKLNDYFINTSECITGSKPLPIKIPNSSNGSFQFHCTSGDQVLNIISKLKTECVAGDDLIPVKYIKLSAHIIAHLTNIINSCIQLNIFPDAWKISRVTPLPKTESPLHMDDYRPISILPALSKIFEKVLIQQIIAHIDSSNIYPPTLSGCRKGHSTSTALLYIRDLCIKSIKSSDITLL